MRKRIFNLLKPVEPPKTVWDKIYDFILYRARIVILITQILIVLAFGGKVIVDTVAKNLDQEIETLQQQLQFLSTLEPQVREIQKKDSLYRNLWKTSYEYNDIFNEVISYIVNPGAEITVAFAADVVTVSGTDDLSALQVLEQKMKSSSSFRNVFITNLTLEPSEASQAKGQYALMATIISPNREELK